MSQIFSLGAANFIHIFVVGLKGNGTMGSIHLKQHYAVVPYNDLLK